LPEHILEAFGVNVADQISYQLSHKKEYRLSQVMITPGSLIKVSISSGWESIHLFMKDVGVELSNKLDYTQQRTKNGLNSK
jgi:hypothetical protein